MQKEHYFLAVAALLLLSVGAWIYFPGLNGPFVFDDQTNIVDVPGIRLIDLSMASLQKAWNARELDALIGRPIAMLSFAINYYFAGLDVFYYKLTNLVIHLLTGVALYWLTLILLKRNRGFSRLKLYEKRHLPWLALGIVGVWLLHPLNLTSVLYVVQRMTSLSALFLVLGLIGYCHGREQIILGKKIGLVTVTVSLVLFGLLSTLCKENGVLVLPLAAVIELAFYRFEAHTTLVPQFRRLWLVVILLPIVLGAAMVLVQHERWFGERAYVFRDFTSEERLLTQTRALWFYLRLLFLPIVSEMGLHHDDFPTSHSLVEPPSTLFSLVGIIGLIAVAIIARRRRPVLFFSIAWFLVGHTMESSVFPLEMIYEHRNYLPQYGIMFAFVFYVGAPARYVALKRTLFVRRAFLVLFGALLAVGTYARSLQWQDIMNLYTFEVMNHPDSPRSHTMLGALLHGAGFYRQAQQHFEIAAKLTPNQAEHLIRLVQNVYTSSHEIPDDLLKELEYRIANNRVSPQTFWVFQPLLKATRDNQRIHDQMIGMYTTLVSRPDVVLGATWYEGAYRVLAENHQYRGRADTALKYYERARSIYPHPSYNIAIANLYLKSGCQEKARALVADLRTQKTDLDSKDVELLREIEALMARPNQLPSNCAL